MKCLNCNCENNDDAQFCTGCGSTFPAQDLQPYNEQPTDQYHAEQYPQQPANFDANYDANYINPQGNSYAYQPPIYPQTAPKTSSPFGVAELCIILGFVLAVIGVFAFSVILLPISLLFAVIGFSRRTNPRTNGLAIAGIIISISAILIKIGMVLHELDLLPDWLIRGIF